MPNTAARPGRSAVYVDLENLVGGSDCDELVIHAAWNVLTCHALRINRGDQVVVGSGTRLASIAWFVLPPAGIRRVVGRGVNGADFALIGDVDLHVLARRYQRLVIASGDGVFAPLAQSARARGVSVTMVSSREAASSDLVRSCPTKVWIPSPDKLQQLAHSQSTSFEAVVRWDAVEPIGQSTIVPARAALDHAA